MGGPPGCAHMGTAIDVRGMTHVEVMMEERRNHNGKSGAGWRQSHEEAPGAAQSFPAAPAALRAYPNTPSPLCGPVS